MGGSLWLKSHFDRLLHTRYVQDIMRGMDGSLVNTRPWPALMQSQVHA
jgi:hypothetical protein